jgi:hypothetical protein
MEQVSNQPVEPEPADTTEQVRTVSQHESESPTAKRESNAEVTEPYPPGAATRSDEAIPQTPQPAHADDVVATPQPQDSAAEVVPLARLRGVQRQLSQMQKELAATRTEANNLRESLGVAEKRAAGEYAERLRATRNDIVPQLIGGETLELVEQSLANSKAAFNAAQQAYARQLPTPAPARVGNDAATGADHVMTPLQLLRAGLAQPKDDINR